ncbi:MAG TPA: SET domain-containing protein-lysine N-methyltransferase [Polyangiaceae bacterium]|nr:SET domain-containing protein-lysine N-methyltransferase [Polyangiaceae bacterium]
MPKPHRSKALFSTAPVLFKNSPIEGRGVFVRKRFQPGDVVVAYAPKQRRLDADDPEAVAASATKLSLLSERHFVIVPDVSVPGGWLCNHSCDPNAALYSDGEGRVECTRTILPGEEVTIFYGWVTQNEPTRDPCRCGASNCRGFINFDVSDDDARKIEGDAIADAGLRARIEEYVSYLRSIGQEHVEATILRTLAILSARLR